MIRRPPRSPLFPSTTLSRSRLERDRAEQHRREAAARDQVRDGLAQVREQDRRARDAEQRGKLPARHVAHREKARLHGDRKSTRLNSSHLVNSYAVFCFKKKK